MTFHLVLAQQIMWMKQAEKKERNLCYLYA